MSNELRQQLADYRIKLDWILRLIETQRSVCDRRRWLLGRRVDEHYFLIQDVEINRLYEQADKLVGIINRLPPFERYKPLSWEDEQTVDKSEK